LEKVQSGAEVVIEQDSHPIAVLRPVDESVAAAARRLATFGERHGLSLGGLTVKGLLRESRP
jgi:hypothetical protein